jgi:hypothetical protein
MASGDTDIDRGCTRTRNVSRGVDPVVEANGTHCNVAVDYTGGHGKNALHIAQHHHLVFYYLFPTALVAMLYGSVLSMFSAIIATLIAAFFLYDPIYSLYVSDSREVGELIVFAVTALIGPKCIAELRRSPEKCGGKWRGGKLGPVTSYGSPRGHSTPEKGRPRERP